MAITCSNSTTFSRQRLCTHWIAIKEAYGTRLLLESALHNPTERRLDEHSGEITSEKHFSTLTCLGSLLPYQPAHSQTTEQNQKKNIFSRWQTDCCYSKAMPFFHVPIHCSILHSCDSCQFFDCIVRSSAWACVRWIAEQFAPNFQYSIYAECVPVGVHGTQSVRAYGKLFAENCLRNHYHYRMQATTGISYSLHESIHMHKCYYTHKLRWKWAVRGWMQTNCNCYKSNRTCSITMRKYKWVGKGINVCSTVWRECKKEKGTVRAHGTPVTKCDSTQMHKKNNAATPVDAHTKKTNFISKMGAFGAQRMT